MRGNTTGQALPSLYCETLLGQADKGMPSLLIIFVLCNLHVGGHILWNLSWCVEEDAFCFEPNCVFGKDEKEAIKAVVDHLILSTVGKQHIFQSHPSCQRNTFLPL
ncbi:hypothetical protein Peur_027294 [Populus x canadensis]